MNLLPGRLQTSITQEEIIESIYSNNREKIAKMLDLFGFYKNGYRLVPGDREDFMAFVCALVSVRIKNNQLDSEIRDELILRFSYSINIFSLIELILESEGEKFKDEDCESREIPKVIKDAIRKQHYNKSAAKEITDLDWRSTLSLMHFLISNNNSIAREFCYPIIETIVRNNIITYDWLFAYIGLTQSSNRKPCRISKRKKEEITFKEITEIIRSNDQKAVVKMLEMFKFYENGCYFVAGDCKKFMAFVCALTSARIKNNQLDDKIKDELILRFSSSTHIFSLIKLILESEGEKFKDEDYESEEIPKAIKNAIEKRRYSEHVAQKIANLSLRSTLSLMYFLTSSYNIVLGKGFTRPVIKAIIKNNIITCDWLFAYIGLTRDIHETPHK